MYILIYNIKFMDNFKIVVFGCWNKGCKENSGQKSVSSLIKANESKYKFMVILGDNYYADKKILSEKYQLKIKETNIQELIDGFKCLDNINLEKKLIMGNHDVDESIDKSCSALKIQLKLPTYDVKFPFGYDLYYLYKDAKKNTYETILFIYLDSSLYNKNLNDTNSCYKSSLNIDIDKLREKQDKFLLDTLSTIIKNKVYNINNVIFFSHEPLFTFKNKKEKIYSSIKTDLIEILFKEKTKYNGVEFYWICADYHIYQNSIITNSLFQGQKISQLIFGTGGGELDIVPTMNTYTEDNNKLQILENVVFNSNGDNISDEFNKFGVEKFGYGEISFDFCSITHKFIAIDNMYGGSDNDYKAKYLKYKAKYIEFKKMI
jgi:hypothetical protein